MSLPNDYLSIDTPENVAFGYDVAGIGSRFLAALLDTVLIAVLQLIVNLTLLFLLGTIFDEVWREEILLWAVAIFGLISFLFLWSYYIFFEMLWNGQSPGKRWIGLRVLKTDGTPITLTESIIRNLVRLVDFLPFVYGVGVVAMFINEQSRRLGDLAANTLVVYDTETVSLDELSQSESRLISHFQTVSPEVEQLPIERLSDQAIQMVEDYLTRRHELTNRTHLANKILQRLYTQMQSQPSVNHNTNADEVLAEIYKLHQTRMKG